MSGRETWDLIVVGAGPGGSATAFFAARQGLRTLLLERARFPRDKTCGDGVGVGGLAVLEAMGVRREDLGGAGQASGFGFSSPGGHTFRHPGLVFESPLARAPMLIAPRAVLDERCARAAAGAGAVLRESTRVCDLLRDGPQVTGVVLEGGATLRGQVVIGADGVHSTVARALGQHSRDRTHTAFALRTYYRDLRNVQDDACFIYDQRFLPAYFWVFPLADGRANVGVGRYDRYCPPGAPNLKEIFARFVAENDLVRHLLEGGQAEGRLKGWPLRLGTSASSGVADGALLVGDANGLVDPLTGEGIHFALRSGQLAAEAAAGAIARGDTSRAGLASFETRWRSEFEREFRDANRALDLLMSRPTLVDAVADLGRRDRRYAVLLGEVFCGLRPKRDLLAPLPLLKVGLAALPLLLPRAQRAPVAH